MKVPLQSRPLKFLLLVLSALIAVIFSALAAIDALAAHYSDESDLESLQRAVKLQPGNADYHYRLGRYYSLVSQSPEQASQAYLSAIKLNPNSARYWLELAGTYQWMGKSEAQKDAVDHAVATEPTTPQVAWEAANYYVVQGDSDRALKEFAVVLANDPYLPPAALQFCWRSSRMRKHCSTTSFHHYPMCKPDSFNFWFPKRKPQQPPRSGSDW